MTCGWICFVDEFKLNLIEHYQNCTSGTEISLLHVVTCMKGSCCKVSGRSTKTHPCWRASWEYLLSMAFNRGCNMVQSWDVLEIGNEIGKLLAIPCPTCAVPGASSGLALGHSLLQSASHDPWHAMAFTCCVCKGLA